MPLEGAVPGAMILKRPERLSRAEIRIRLSGAPESIQ
jgi:hypothetical protein